MTYYEWVECLKKLETSPRDEQLLNTIRNSTIELEGNILYRFINHLNDTVRTRLRNALQKVLKEAGNLCKDLNTLSLHLIDLKKEIKFTQDITNLPFIPDENRRNFKQSIKNFANEISTVLEESFENIDTTGEALKLIKDSKIYKLEEEE